MNGVVVNHLGASCRHCFNNGFRPPKQKCLRGFFSLCRFGTVGEVRWSPKPVLKDQQVRILQPVPNRERVKTWLGLTPTYKIRREQEAPSRKASTLWAWRNWLRRGLQLLVYRFESCRPLQILVDRTGKTSYNVYKLVRRV